MRINIKKINDEDCQHLLGSFCSIFSCWEVNYWYFAKCHYFVGTPNMQFSKPKEWKCSGIQ